MSFRKHDSVPSLVIGEIKRSGRPCTTLELARAVGMNTRKEINPTLYKMERQGMLKKVQDQPPLWQVAQGGTMQGMGVNTGAHGRDRDNRGRGRGRGRGTTPTSGSPPGFKFPSNPQYQFPSSTSANIGFGRGRGRPPPHPTNTTPPAPRFTAPPSISSTPPLRARLQQVLSTAAKPLTALELAKQLDFSSRSSVNPDLYAMEKEGVVIRHQLNPNSPPVWSLPGRNFASQSSSTSGTNALSLASLKGGQIVERDGPSAPNQRLLQSNQSLQSNEVEEMEVGGTEAEIGGEGGGGGRGGIDVSQIPEDDIEQRLLAVLQLCGSSSKRSELELSNSISTTSCKFTRSDIRPHLTSLEGRGVVRRMEGMPVTWQLLSSEQPRTAGGAGNPFGGGGLSSSPKGAASPQKVREISQLCKFFSFALIGSINIFYNNNMVH